MTEWDRCEKWIAQALEYGGELYTVDDIREMVIEGECVFWPGKECAIVTQFWEFPRKKALNFWLAGAEKNKSGLAELQQMHDNICAWGKLNGCTLSFITGRAGWSRVLGYKPAWTAMSKELD